MSASSRWLRVNGQHLHGCPMRRKTGKECDCGMLAAIEADERTARRDTTEGPCLHPVTRRIGDYCAACGALVKGAKK